MKQKLLAAAAAVAIALGMVATSATAANAHHNTISAVVSCNDDFTYTVSWSITNSENLVETITASSDQVLVPNGTTIQPLETLVVEEVVTSAVKKDLVLSAAWSNNATNTSTGKVKTNDFATCAPPQHVPVSICHAKSQDGSNGWTTPPVDDDSIVKESGHAEHEGDIIPAFSYWVKDAATDLWTQLYYEGKNLDRVWFGATGQEILDAGCVIPSTTPAEVTFQNSVCTTPGDSSQATFTIAATEGVVYQYRVNGGVWIDAAAGIHNATDGTTVEVQAVAVPGYNLTGTVLWSYAFVTAGDCLVAATPIVPTFDDATCIEPGEQSTSSFTITAVAGVSFEAKIGDGEFAPIASGVHTVADGTSVIITATDDDGYILTGDAEWSHLFPADNDCFVKANPVEPGVTNQTCNPELSQYVSGFITIANTEGVTYLVDGSAVSAGDVEVAPGMHTVSAIAQANYSLFEYKGPWQVTILSALPCGDLPTHPLVTPEAVTQADTCGNSGSFTVPATEGILWFIGTGEVLPGTHQVSGAQAFTVTAIALAPAYGLEEGAQSSWPLEFTSSSSDCVVNTASGDLATLALTGSDSLLVGTGAAFLFLGLGAMFLARRKTA